jgi:outer membrane protein W
MIRKVMPFVFILLATIFDSGGTLYGQSVMRSSGVVLRATFWDVNDDEALIAIRNDWDHDEVGTGHAGGWLCFFSRVTDRAFVELHLGAMGRVGIDHYTLSGDEVDVSGLIPILLGLRYHVLPASNSSSLQPYVAAGGGPYWANRVRVYEPDFPGSEVTIHSKMHTGFFVGGGIYFHLASWFALNWDMKLHCIDFDPNHDYSGLEVGFGFSFLWGRYHPPNP